MPRRGSGGRRGDPTGALRERGSRARAVGVTLAAVPIPHFDRAALFDAREIP